MRMPKTRGLPAITWALAGVTMLLPAKASAQFVGDVFFAEPSVVIAEGGTGQLQLALFAGDKVFGATRAALKFDATKMQIVDVQAPAVGGLTPALQWKVTGGELRLLVVNGESLQKPIGTVTLARITVKPLGSAGQQFTVTSEVSDALAADRTTFRVGTGFSAQVSVGVKSPSGTGGNPRALLMPGQDPALERMALTMRPAGHQVRLHAPAGGGQFREVSVQTLDPRAASAEGGSAKPAQ